MRLKNNIQFLLILVILISCQKKKTSSKNTNKEEEAWSYSGESGPEHWAELEKNSECGGKFQSPINIISINAKIDSQLNSLDIHYEKSTKIHSVKNNGHSIQYNFEKGDYINYKNECFNLKQIHFHESSEHTIDGVRYPLVIHMVHANSTGEYLVLAIMAKEGKTSIPFEFLESFLPLEKGEVKKINKPFNLNHNLPLNRGYYSYTGSLTTPPCTEGVKWFIFKEPITISVEQVNILKTLMPVNNYRKEQPLNGRKIQMTE